MREFHTNLIINQAKGWEAYHCFFPPLSSHLIVDLLSTSSLKKDAF